MLKGVLGVLKQSSKDPKGVKSIVPGYAGGTLEDPLHDQVCTGDTGHTESD